MKTALILLAAGLAGLAGPLKAGDGDAPIRTCARLSSYQKCDLSRLEQRFLTSLRHQVDGVVESAIREVTLVKMAQPSVGSVRILEALVRLAETGRTPSIRVKSFLGSIVYENPGWFTREGSVEYATDEEVFGAILSRLRGTMIASER